VIEVTVGEYEATRSDDTRFLVAPGHTVDEIERAVATSPAFEVVQVDEAHAPIARALSPQRRRPGGS
jgi:hypothetical protein